MFATGLGLGRRDNGRLRLNKSERVAQFNQFARGLSRAKRHLDMALQTGITTKLWLRKMGIKWSLLHYSVHSLSVLILFFYRSRVSMLPFFVGYRFEITHYIYLFD